ncbi:hypothetical protein GCM10009725_30290 [Aeromicrobium tamlense]
MSTEPTVYTAGVSSELSNDAALQKASQTTQLIDRNVGTEMGMGIQPPYPPDLLAGFQEINGTHVRSLDIKSQWEVGFGFNIVPHPRAGDDPSEEQKERVEDFWYGRDSSWKAGPRGTGQTTPSKVLKLGRQDYHGIGWTSLEILTKNNGEPAGLAHVPSKTTRVRKVETDGEQIVRGRGYVQRRGGRTRFFGEAGDRWGDDSIFVDRVTGRIGSEVDNPANELLYIPNESPLALYYGIPAWVSEIQTMIADQEIKEYNIDFFDNNAIPYVAIIVKNGELTQSSRESLQEMIHGMNDQPHRTVILEVKKLVDDGDFRTEGGQPADIEIEPLGVTQNEDMAFSNFREMNEHDIAKVHGVPKQLINRYESSNRSNISESIAAFANEEIAPEQDAFAEHLYQILHVKGLDAPDWTIEFELKGGENKQRKVDVVSQAIRASQGSITVNEARRMLADVGFDIQPFTDEEGNDLPIGGQLLADLDSSDGDDAEFMATVDDQPPRSKCVGKRSSKDVVVKAPLDMQQFDSSNLVSGLYDFETKDLYIRFHGDPQDRIYVYLDVPASTWDGLVNASSHGSYHHENIKWDFVYEELSASDWPQVGAAAPTNNGDIKAFLEA